MSSTPNWPATNSTGPPYTPTAIERAERAFTHRRPGETRSRTFDAISLADAHLLNEDFTHAEQYGHLAIGMTSQIASVRAVDRLRTFAQLARPHLDHSGIAAVVEDIDQLQAS